MGMGMRQKDPLSKREYGPLSDIEIRRISVNGARFETIFHANRIGAIYGLFRDGDGIGNSESGAESGVFLSGRSYLPGPGSVKVVPDPLIRHTLFRA